MLHCRFGSVALADQRQQRQRRAKQRQMSDEGFHPRIGDMAVGMKDPGGDFDQFAGMANEHNLAETEPNRLFNHVADEVAHGDHHLRVDAHLLADKALTVVARHQHHALQPGGAFYLQLEGERALPALFRHRGNDPRGADNRDPAEDPQPGVIGFLRAKYAFRSKNLHLRAAGRTYRFAHGGLDGVPRSAVYRRAACRQADPFAGHRADTLPALQANLSAVIEGDPGKNQHAVGGVDIIAAVFTDRGDRLLPFDVRGLNVQAQGDAGGGDDRDLMNQMLAHHHQRRHFCRRCGAGAGGVALAQRFAVMPHRGVKGLIAHCASRRW